MSQSHVGTALDQFAQAHRDFILDIQKAIEHIRVLQSLTQTRLATFKLQHQNRLEEISSLVKSGRRTPFPIALADAQSARDALYHEIRNALALEDGINCIENCLQEFVITEDLSTTRSNALEALLY